MIRTFVLILVGSVALAGTAGVQRTGGTQPAREVGFTPLFNGKDLTGWVYGTRNGKPNKSGNGYQVENGVLFTTKEDGGNLFT